MIVHGSYNVFFVNSDSGTQISLKFHTFTLFLRVFKKVIVIIVFGNATKWAEMFDNFVLSMYSLQLKLQHENYVV